MDARRAMNERPGTGVEAIERGLAHADQTAVVEVGRGVIGRVGAIVRDSLCADGRPALVVADERTWVAALRGGAGIAGAGRPGDGGAADLP